MKKLSKFKISFSGRCIFAACSATVLILFCYFSNNQPVFTKDNTNAFHFTEKVTEVLHISEKDDYSDVVFINVSNDKVLVNIPEYETDTTKIYGHRAITDRKELSLLLKCLNENDSYKYIILDLSFDKQDYSIFDSTLFSQIKETNRIVFVNNKEHPFFINDIDQKAALANYLTTITSTGFIRYKYSSDGRRYVPLKVYEDENPTNRLTQHGKGFFSYYTIGGKLCYNSTFIRFDATQLNNFKHINENLSINEYYNLGEDFISLYSKGFPIDYIKDKLDDITSGRYVIICDMVDDIHDTYMGKRPGGIILYKALKALQNNRTIVKWHYYVFLWILLYCICIFISRKPQHNEWTGIYKFIGFLVSVISITLIISIFQALEYTILHTVHNLLIPIIYLTLSKIFFDYRNFEQE